MKTANNQLHDYMLHKKNADGLSTKEIRLKNYSNTTLTESAGQQVNLNPQSRYLRPNRYQKISEHGSYVAQAPKEMKNKQMRYSKTMNNLEPLYVCANRSKSASGLSNIEAKNTGSGSKEKR